MDSRKEENRYYLVVIDILFMFLVVLLVSLMSMSFETDGDTNTNYNSINSLKMSNPEDQRADLFYLATVLKKNEIQLFRVSSRGTEFVGNYAGVEDFSKSNLFKNNINFVIFDSEYNPFLGDVVRKLNKENKLIAIAK